MDPLIKNVDWSEAPLHHSKWLLTMSLVITTPAEGPLRSLELPVQLFTGEDQGRGAAVGAVVGVLG